MPMPLRSTSALKPKKERKFAEHLKNVGNKNYHEHNYKNALDLYTKAIELCPTSIIYNNRAICLMVMQHFDVALLDAQNACKLDSTQKAVISLGKCCLALGNIFGTEQAAKALAKLNRNSSALSYEKKAAQQLRPLDDKIRRFYGLQRYAKAIGFIEEALKLAPCCKRYQLLRAECAAFLNIKDKPTDSSVAVQNDYTELSEAIEMLEQELCQHPELNNSEENVTIRLKEAIALRGKARSLLRLGRCTEANDICDKAKELLSECEPMVERKHNYLRALALLNSTKVLDGIQLCDEILSLHSTYIPGLLLRASCLSQFEMYREAVDDCEAAFALVKTPEMQKVLHCAHLEWRQMLQIHTNHYTVLGVSRNATMRQIKEAFNAKSRRYHPDRRQTDGRVYHQFQFTAIKTARNILMNVKSRAAYDAELGEDESFESDEDIGREVFSKVPASKEAKHSLAKVAADYLNKYYFVLKPET